MTVAITDLTKHLLAEMGPMSVSRSNDRAPVNSLSKALYNLWYPHSKKDFSHLTWHSNLPRGRFVPANLPLSILQWSRRYRGMGHTKWRCWIRYQLSSHHWWIGAEHHWWMTDTLWVDRYRKEKAGQGHLPRRSVYKINICLQLQCRGFRS